MGALKSPVSPCSVICLPGPGALGSPGGSLYIQNPGTTPDLNSELRILVWFVCTLKFEKPFCRELGFKSRCADNSEGWHSLSLFYTLHSSFFKNRIHGVGNDKNLKKSPGGVFTFCYTVEALCPTEERGGNLGSSGESAQGQRR